MSDPYDPSDIDDRATYTLRMQRPRVYEANDEGQFEAIGQDEDHEIEMTGAQLRDVLAGRPSVEVVRDEQVFVDEDGTIVHRDTLTKPAEARTHGL